MTGRHDDDLRLLLLLACAESCSQCQPGRDCSVDDQLGDDARHGQRAVEGNLEMCGLVDEIGLNPTTLAQSIPMLAHSMRQSIRNAAMLAHSMRFSIDYRVISHSAKTIPPNAYSAKHDSAKPRFRQASIPPNLDSASLNSAKPRFRQPQFRQTSISPAHKPRRARRASSTAKIDPILFASCSPDPGQSNGILYRRVATLLARSSFYSIPTRSAGFRQTSIPPT